MWLSQAGDAGGVNRVEMQHHARLRQPLMDLTVNRPGSGVHVVALRAGGVIGVEQQQIAGADAGKVLPLRVKQKLPAIRRDRRAEVVCDRLVHAEMRNNAKGRSKIDAGLFFK